MALNYGSEPIPSDSYSVEEGGTITVAAAFERSVGFLGGMDTANGTVNEGELIKINSSREARDAFGGDSELYYQSDLAFSNGATEVYAVAVPETEATESFSSASSGQLSNTPFFNPEIHNEHDITAQDTSEAASVEVNIVYVDGSPSAPSTSNTINLDYVTGQWTADASSSYDITYTYGDYTSADIQKLLDEDLRAAVVLTENESLIDTLDTELQNDAGNLQFASGVGGAVPFEDSDSPDTANYSDGLDTERISLVSSPYWYLDDAETNLQRVHGAAAGEMASLPLGESATMNELSGLESPRTNFTPSEAGDLTDAQVLPIINYPPATIIKDMTTSTTGKFERVYAMNVIDEVVTLSSDINRRFLGEQPIDENIGSMETSLTRMLRGLERSSPPLLNASEDKAYDVSVTQNATNNNQIDVKMSIDVVGVIDNIVVDMTVGDIIEAEVS